MEEHSFPSPSSQAPLTTIPVSTQPLQSSSHKTLFIVLGIVIFLLLAILAYFFFIKEKDSSLVNSQTSSTASLTPEQTFIQYRTEVAKAGNFDEYAQVILKWGDKSTLAKMQADQEKMDKATPEQKLLGYNLMKTLMTPLDKIDLANFKKQVNDTTTILTGYTLDNKSQVTVTLLKEGSAWKLNKESWTNNRNV